MVAPIADKRLATPVRAVRRLPPGSGVAGVVVHTDRSEQRFDDVVLATHTDQALALLNDATAAEQRVLGAIRYQPNRVVLHRDASVLPQRRRAWAAWNYERAPQRSREEAAVCLHYLINRLQPLPWTTPVVVSMNPLRTIREDAVLGEWTYAHPVFDRAAVRAQNELPSIQGHAHVWFCGAWARYGFHEDGLMSGMAAAQSMLERWAQSEPAAA
jgi:predicted NAD/FAD-binding protein